MEMMKTHNARQLVRKEVEEELVVGRPQVEEEVVKSIALKIVKCLVEEEQRKKLLKSMMKLNSLNLK